jgi:ATP-dependent Clp protease ATP-binding subunit ClpA
MFERFTAEARDVVLGAVEAAEGLDAPRVGTEHLLLALLADTGPTRRALSASGVTADGVREAVAADPPGGAADDGGPDPAALAAIGIDFDEVRRAVERSFGPGALERALGLERSRRRWRRGAGGHRPFSKPAKRTLELALREALARGDRHIGAEHILLGLTRTSGTGASRVLDRLGVDVTALRQALIDELPRKAG